jgi:Pheophorbide a oxygenase
MAMNQQPKKNGGKCCFHTFSLDPIPSHSITFFTHTAEWQTAIIFFVVPMREGYTRLITTFDTLSPHRLTPDWILHIINQKSVPHRVNCCHALESIAYDAPLLIPTQVPGG